MPESLSEGTSRTRKGRRMRIWSKLSWVAFCDRPNCGRPSYLIDAGRPQVRYLWYAITRSRRIGEAAPRNTYTGFDRRPPPSRHRGTGRGEVSSAAGLPAALVSDSRRRDTGWHLQFFVDLFEVDGWNDMPIMQRWPVCYSAISL